MKFSIELTIFYILKELCQMVKQSVDPPNQKNCDKRICRICLSDSHDDENPLLDPCHCSGTMNYIHYYCLQTWLIKRLNLEKSKGVISILWQSLICELCHTVYPLTMNYKDRTYDLINFFENPEYICYMNNDMSNNNNSTFCNRTRNTMLLKSFTKEGLPNGLHLIEFSTGNNNEITIVINIILFFCFQYNKIIKQNSLFIRAEELIAK